MTDLETRLANALRDGDRADKRKKCKHVNVTTTWGSDYPTRCSDCGAELVETLPDRKLTWVTPRHGGARPGAGRPKGSKSAPKLMPLDVKVTSNLDRHTYANLERRAIYEQRSVALVVRQLIENEYRCNCGDCKAARHARGEK